MPRAPSRLILVRRLVLLAAFALASCGDFVSGFCDLCPGGDPGRVPPEKIAQVRLLNGVGPLPAGARNVYYYVKCGVDCSQFIRFDIELADARAFARALPLEHPLTPGGNPWGPNPWGGGRPVWDEVIALGWWPREFPSGVEGGENMSANGNPPFRIAILPRGRQARVWIHTFET